MSSEDLPHDRKKHREDLNNKLGALHPKEEYWRDRYTWFIDQGYQLRPRFSPDWIPSWRGTGKLFNDFEDGQILKYTRINDAIQISTGSRVILKKVLKRYEPFEEEITRHFSSAPLSEDPRNHCIPLLDVLEPPPSVRKSGGEEDHYRILVLPFLRPFHSPNFDTLGEAIECIRQLFEGLQFMHENHTAHRDLNVMNFMMEAHKMFPEGYNMNDPSLKPDLSGPTKFYTRTERPPKYFLIDLGHSRKFDASNTSPLAPILVGGDKTVPEFQDTFEPQNPFPTDIYYAGNLIREEFLDGNPHSRTSRGYRGFEFLRPLINDMIQDDPTKRPTIDEVVKRFEDLTSGFGAWKLRSRTSSRKANAFRDLAHVFFHWTRKIGFVFQGIPAIPRT